MSVTINGTTGIAGVDGSASTPAVQGTDTNTGIFFPAADTIAFGEGGAEVARFDSSGNLGIGTSSPISKLSVLASGTAVTTVSSDAASNATIEGPNVAIASSFSSQLAILSNSSVAADTGGGIAFGGKYNGNAFAYYAAVKTGKDNATSGEFGGYLSFASRANGGDITERVRITSGGAFKATNNGTYASSTATYHEFNMSIGDENVLRMYHRAASNPYGPYVEFNAADPNNATNYVFGAYTITGGAWMYRIYSNGTVAARSDAKHKKNIETARNGYLEDLAKLRIVKYNWYNHEEGEPKELGLVAQEVEQVFPGLVQTDEDKKDEIRSREIPAVLDEDGNEIEPARTEEYTERVGKGEYTKSIKFSVFTPMLIKAVQELKAINDAQATRIETLEAQNAAFETRLAALEAK